MDCPSCGNKISHNTIFYGLHCKNCEIPFINLICCVPEYGYGYYVYLLYKNNKMIYVGVTKNLRKRLGNHKDKTGLTFSKLTYDNFKKNGVNVGISLFMGEKMIHEIFNKTLTENRINPPILLGNNQRENSITASHYLKVIKNGKTTIFNTKCEDLSIIKQHNLMVDRRVEQTYQYDGTKSYGNVGLLFTIEGCDIEKINKKWIHRQRKYCRYNIYCCCAIPCNYTKYVFKNKDEHKTHIKIRQGIINLSETYEKIFESQKNNTTDIFLRDEYIKNMKELINYEKKYKGDEIIKRYLLCGGV